MGIFLYFFLRDILFSNILACDTHTHQQNEVPLCYWENKQHAQNKSGRRTHFTALHCLVSPYQTHIPFKFICKKSFFTYSVNSRCTVRCSRSAMLRKGIVLSISDGNVGWSVAPLWSRIANSHMLTVRLTQLTHFTCSHTTRPLSHSVKNKCITDNVSAITADSSDG